MACSCSVQSHSGVCGGVIHEMMQFEGCVLAVFSGDCLFNTGSQLTVDLQLQLVEEGGETDGIR